MRPWTSIGSRSLFGALRPLTRPSERSFTTTSVLQRSRQRKKLRAQRAEKSKDQEEQKKTVSPTSSNSAVQTRADRKNVAAARDFENVVAAALDDVQNKLKQTKELTHGWSQFERNVTNACRMKDQKLGVKWSPLRQIKVSLQRAYLDRGVPGLRDELEYQAQAADITAKFSVPNLEGQLKVADLRYPAEWYPQTRSIQRTIHLHVGPTNSGKTYHALKRLEQAKDGFYAGPLRLLAQEVYQRFKAKDIPCSLVTGDEVKIPESGLPRVVSNTVEMVNLGQPYEVGVIDEIQMIANPDRGWAWTRAVLGAQASELHLCGETRTVPLIRELCALTGDQLEIHRYERLNPLRVMDRSLKGDLKNLEKGDCLVAFSRIGIHTLKAEIEKTTGRRAAIVYGGLPAEIRTQQASLFNDPDNDYDFLVASDAIGMGLNLSCKRIIFETVVKRTPKGLIRLTVPEIKQIGGRAGRYRAANSKEGIDDGENVGLVTSLEDIDLPYILRAMKIEPPPVSAAGIVPPDPVFHRFSAYFPRSVPFEYLIKRLVEIAQHDPLFFMCDMSGQLENAEVIDTASGLQLQDQLTLMAAPMGTRTSTGRNVVCAFADCVAQNSDGRLLDIPHLNLEVLEEAVSGTKEYMHELEELHRSVILYAWMSYRFGGIFTDRTLAAHVKELVEERMVRALTEFSANKNLRKDASLKRQIAMQKQMMHQSRLMAAADMLDPQTGDEQATRDRGQTTGEIPADESPLEDQVETEVEAQAPA